ncbi:hypothetical protein LXL04_008768 [Taraxacum kok-saghyz]
MKPKLGDIFESPEQLKFCVANYVVAKGLQYVVVGTKRALARSDCMPGGLQKEFKAVVSTGQRRRAKKWSKEKKSDYICFLKGEVKGELLTAIGWDANNQVVVDVESKPNWTWFLELLHDDLNLNSGRGLELLEVVKDILPNVEHMQCQKDEGKVTLRSTLRSASGSTEAEEETFSSWGIAIHIYSNFKKACTRLEYKKLFWASAMSYVEGDFKRNMAELKKLSHGAYDYLISKQPRSWCKAYFNGGYTCEVVENDISEYFDTIIGDARKKSLITILE